VRRLIDQNPAYELVAAVDAFSGEGYLRTLNDFAGEADCVIDFSHPSATDALLEFACARRLPLVIATTGQTDAQRAAIQAAGAQIPVFFSANMSPAIALLAGMARQTARMFPDADIEIIEKHHNRKLDMPSGTALMLARALQAQREDAERMIGIHSLRMGNEVGTHEIIIATGTQTITLKHEAEDRALFAEGALAAAAFIVSEPNGVYNMHDFLNRKGQ
jgi:4-hydroxy-tetrahydrodipicolinate reductase